MSKTTSKRNQEISCKNDESKIDVKKRKLETVHPNLLSYNANSSNGKSLTFVNLSKTTAMNDDNVLQKYNDVAVTGLNYVHLIMIMIIINYINI